MLKLKVKSTASLHECISSALVISLKNSAMDIAITSLTSGSRLHCGHSSSYLVYGDLLTFYKQCLL